jgi:hypothetical protein
MRRRPTIYLLAVALAVACFSVSAAPRPADGRVAYLQIVDKGCTAGIWDSKSRTSRILGSLPACPETVSVTSHEQALVLIFPTSIRLIDLSTGKIGDAIPMPADAVTTSRDKEASLAGYTADGTLALSLHDINADNSGISQLFLFKDGVWKKAAERACIQYDKCLLQPAIEARALDDVYGIGPNGLFNQSLTADPYVTHRSSVGVPRDPSAEGDEAPPDEMKPTHVALSFHVDGRDSQLLFDLVPGEDTDGFYTFGLKLVLPDARTITITADDQYGAALVGHYLLYHGFFENGMRLYDVGNGDVILDQLSTGGWLEPALPK